ncbi:MAG: hypothetical protein JNK11_18310 [Alphaproteobacteria bacterium]|nr:hypothetical protein [Alphaproteobacteria bacterium]
MDRTSILVILGVPLLLAALAALFPDAPLLRALFAERVDPGFYISRYRAAPDHKALVAKLDPGSETLVVFYRSGARSPMEAIGAAYDDCRFGAPDAAGSCAIYDVDGQRFQILPVERARSIVLYAEGAER